MDTSIEIAGKLTIADWLAWKEKMNGASGEAMLWEQAFEFYEKRLHTRYIDPIEVIERISKNQGEGFAICSVLCSLVEALESFYQGKTYRRATKENPLNEKTEYYKSQPIFESFLTNREPFKKYFSHPGLASAFYENFRCPILHEAATRNGWIVGVGTKELLEMISGQITVNRRILFTFIKEFMQSYKKELLNSKELQLAFVRKMDAICETA